jgi:adenylate cyclase class IV
MPPDSRVHRPLGGAEPRRNVEIKARVADLAGLRARVAARATETPAVIHQVDTFFPVAHGRLKLRRFDDGRGELIFYERDDTPGPRTSAYSRAACAEAPALEALLARALGVRGVVAKRREVFLIGRTRVHLDDVRGLGSFLEIEVALADGEPAAEGEREARALLAALEVPAAALVGPAYIDLLEGARPAPS